MEEKDIKKEEQEVNTDDMAVETPTDEVTEEQTDANVEEAEEETDPLKAAEDQIVDLKDKLLRQMAEFDNYRKRTL